MGTGTVAFSNFINSNGEFRTSGLTDGWIEYAGASTANTATHVVSLPWDSSHGVIKIFWSAGLLGNQSLIFSASTDNFSSVTNMDGMYSFFQSDSSGNVSNGNVSEPNDGLNEQYIKITANHAAGDVVKGETTLYGGTFHSNGSATRRNQFSWRTETVTHQGTGIYVERVFSHGQVARALAGSESTMPTHVRWHELGGNNIDFKYIAFKIRDNY
tara:strand:- start:318 stop:959 length:642 start_codon:yes stop_codon:yes gene_type:complete